MTPPSPPGEVQVLDLGHSSQRPVATLRRGGEGGVATCLAFNAQSPQLLAVGGGDGTVAVWRLSSELTEQRPEEDRLLEQIANQVAG